jgi:hypothetical protein
MIDPTLPASQRLFMVAEYIQENAPTYQDVWLAMLHHVAECPPDDWWAKAKLKIAEYHWSVEFEISHSLFREVAGSPNVSLEIRSEAVIYDAMLLGVTNQHVELTELASAIEVCERHNPAQALQGLLQFAWQLRLTDFARANEYLHRAVVGTQALFGGRADATASVLASAAQFAFTSGEVDKARGLMANAVNAAPDTASGGRTKVRLQTVLDKWPLDDRKT